MGLYKITRPDGSVEYTDLPSGPGPVQTADAGSGEAVAQPSEAERREDYERAKSIIEQAKKRIPKLKDYLEYLDYLRTYRPLHFDEVMSQLKRQDPATWQRLQRYPQFRPLRETAVGLKAGNNILQAATKLPTGGVAGTFEYWLEATLKSMMKRDRYGPYAEVLGDKGRPFIEKPTTYSNSRWGEFMKVEGPKLAEASKAATKELQLATAMGRAAVGSTIGDVGGPFMQLVMGALDVQSLAGISYFRGLSLAQELKDKGILTEKEAYFLPRMLAAKEFDKVVEMINAGVARAKAQE
jgi:hypothetical protein